MDELERFLNWYLSEMDVLSAVPFSGAVSKIENVTGVLMYRQGQFQVQMFCAPEGTIIPEHTHPNVDSYEVYVGGNIKFTHRGKWVVADNELKPKGDLNTAHLRGFVIRVKPDDPHGGVFGEGGGVFLSVQHWLNGVKPHCVAADYVGGVMGPDHLSKVKTGAPELVDIKTAMQEIV